MAKAIENEKAIIRWQGAGWYAPRQEGQEGDVTFFYFCGVNPRREPSTYGLGLGTPDWFPAIPSDMEEW